jgi:hypothetical protein
VLPGTDQIKTELQILLLLLLAIYQIEIITAFEKYILIGIYIPIKLVLFKLDQLKKTTFQFIS